MNETSMYLPQEHWYILDFVGVVEVRSCQAVVGLLLEGNAPVLLHFRHDQKPLQIFQDGLYHIFSKKRRFNLLENIQHWTSLSRCTFPQDNHMDFQSFVPCNSEDRSHNQEHHKLLVVVEGLEALVPLVHQDQLNFFLAETDFLFSKLCRNFPHSQNLGLQYPQRPQYNLVGLKLLLQ